MRAGVKLIYIGPDFYMESGTRMSCIYTEDGRRSDWGQVESVLMRGGVIEIRPATDAERAPYLRMLDRLVFERNERRRAEVKTEGSQT